MIATFNFGNDPAGTSTTTTNTTMTNGFYVRFDRPTDDDGTAGVREPRRPKPIGPDGVIEMERDLAGVWFDPGGPMDALT